MSFKYVHFLVQKLYLNNAILKIYIPSKIYQKKKKNFKTTAPPKKKHWLQHLAVFGTYWC